MDKLDGPSTSKYRKAMQNEGMDLNLNNCIDETSETRQITEQPENNSTTVHVRYINT